jgi:hypothetical protein|tara:strand:+ start:1553 stop:2269 length:717 start_codon:yes stop_codon:yes gene_type:complete
MTTKYFEKKQDGVLFARAPKDLANPAQEGATERQWNYQGKAGSTWGWEQKNVEGLIESAFVSDFGEDVFFNIGLQQVDGTVAVFKNKLYTDTFQLVQAFRNIDLDKALRVESYVNTKGAYTNKDGINVIPAAISLKQGGKMIPWVFNRNKEEKRWSGPEGVADLPEIQKKTSMGRTKYDKTDQYEFMEKEIEIFIARVDEIEEARKASRPQTANEIAAKERVDTPINVDVAELVEGPF